jgi:hypothetical protein
MPSALDSPGLTADRHGFILVHETFCHGISPALWDDANPFVFYGSHAEAEAERVDFAEMRAEAEDDAGMDLENADDGPWVEAAVLHPDGMLTLPDLRLTFTMDGLRGFLR